MRFLCQPVRCGSGCWQQPPLPPPPTLPPPLPGARHQQPDGSYVTVPARPVLLIWGELDTLNPLAVGEEVKRCFCNAQLVVVKNAGHIAMYDQQRQVVQTMAAFLKLPPETSVDRVVFPLSMRFPLSAEGSGRFSNGSVNSLFRPTFWTRLVLWLWVG